MKNLLVDFISNAELTDGMAGISSFLNEVERQRIDTLLWSTDGYKPVVSFAIAFTEDAILLKFFVAEKYVEPNYHQINDPVYKDSCVEFFIAFGDDKSYYNLEFNAIGIALIGYGADKTHRELLHKSVISKIRSEHTIDLLSGDKNIPAWELTLSIPFTVFVHNNIVSLTGKDCRGNFYKCGDDLPDPHFLSWSAINYPQPNFHLPQFFGSIRFV